MPFTTTLKGLNKWETQGEKIQPLQGCFLLLYYSAGKPAAIQIAVLQA